MRITSRLSMIASMQFGISGPLDCNVYALAAPDGIVLVDSGAGTHTDVLLRNLEGDLGSGPVRAVLLTHNHADHAAGAAGIRQRTGCRVVCPRMSRAAIETGDEEATGLARARVAGTYPANFVFEPCPIDSVYDDSKSFEVAGLEFQPIHVAGHSPDAFCLLTTGIGGRWLFSGDVVFYGGILGLINAEGSDPRGYRDHLPKLTDLGIEALLPGHGLFTMRNGQHHIDTALRELAKGFLPRQIGQGDMIF